MILIRFFNERVKRLTIWDIELAQGGAMVIALIAAKLIPDILRLDYLWYVLFIVVLGVRPVYVFFLRKSPA